METEELASKIRKLADEVEHSHPDVGACLLTISGAMVHGKIDELSDTMVHFAITAVAELVDGDDEKRERFRVLLRDNLMKEMEQR